MAPTLLRRNGGLEDRVTMSKLAAGKRWDVSKHNTARCVLCEEEFDSQRHPLMECIGYEVHEARNNWQKNPLVKTLFSMERGALLAFYHGKVSSRSMIGKLNLIFCLPKTLIFFEIGWGKLF